MILACLHMFFWVADEPFRNQDDPAAECTSHEQPDRNFAADAKAYNSRQRTFVAGAPAASSSAKLPSLHFNSLITLWPPPAEFGLGCASPPESKAHCKRASRRRTNVLSTRSQKRSSANQHRGITRNCMHNAQLPGVTL